MVYVLILGMGIAPTDCFRFSCAVKSTCSAAVCRGVYVSLVGRFGFSSAPLFSPSSGQIFNDGRDIASLDLRSLREQLSLFGQEVVLFNDTIAFNVGYDALHDAPEAESRASLSAANL